MVKVELEQSMIRTMWRFCWIPKGVWYTNSSRIVGELKQWSSSSQNISWHPANEKETETVRRDVKAGTSFCVRYCFACNSLRVGSWKWAGSFLVSNNNRAIDLILAATLTSVTLHYFCSTYNNTQQGSRGTESDTTEITHVGNLSTENKDKYATKMRTDKNNEWRTESPCCR